MKPAITADEVKELTDDWIGPTLVALAAGSRSRDVVAFWCTDYAEPNEDEARRLAFTLEILREVEQGERSRDVARAWFIGGNVGEELVSPGEAIRDDRFDEVRASAHRLIHDIPFSA